MTFVVDRSCEDFENSWVFPSSSASNPIPPSEEVRSLGWGVFQRFCFGCIEASSKPLETFKSLRN